MPLLMKKVLEVVLSSVLIRALGAASSVLRLWILRMRKRAEIRRLNRQIREQNEAAKTKEERDEAAKKLLERL